MNSFLLGINFNCIWCAKYQNRSSMPIPPDNYIDDSFKIFQEEGINCIRIPIYWESYEYNTKEFLEELDFISNIADKYNILCIYDNHQWECSSYLGYGIGFPNSLLMPYFNKEDPNKISMESPTQNDLKKFWNNWWDRNLVTEDGKDCWDAQLEYVEKVVKKVKDKKSTLGFEILNEPQIYRRGDFKTVGKYHKYMLEKLSLITDKAFFICTVNSSVSIYHIFPHLQSKIKPSKSIKNSLFYDIHPYPPSIPLLIIYKMTSLLMNNMPIYAGEFNSGIKKGVTISQNDFIKYIKLLKCFSASGCALWQWSFIQDNDHPAFNLTDIIDNKIRSKGIFKN